MEPTWYKRELPIIEAAVRWFEERPGEAPQAFDLAPAVGLDEDEVGRVLRSLDGEYLDVDGGTFGGLRTVTVMRAHPAARRAVGQWPTAESVAERLIAGIDQAAETEPDPERKSKLKATALFLGSAGKDLTINLIASMIAKSAGIG